MTARAVFTERAYRPSGAYSQAIVAGGIVYVAGQAPFAPDDGRILGSDIAAQTDATIDNLEAVLAAAGCSLRDVVKVSAHLADFDLFEGYDAAYRNRFSEPLPARITVASDLGGILVEMDCIAVLPS